MNKKAERRCFKYSQYLNTLPINRQTFSRCFNQENVKSPIFSLYDVNVYWHRPCHSFLKLETSLGQFPRT
jgi:hypothetical protein